MTIDTQILQTITQMPESLKQEVLHYAKYLIENYSESKSGEEQPQKKRRAGILKGTFVLPLPDMNLTNLSKILRSIWNEPISSRYSYLYLAH